ncbi:MAG: alpha/beta hydrolase [Candidatus Obscuribacterales bacterium]|nr:alpha/beta hydrolase [Candidatus Obscuribacterales bacterium]
MRSLIFLTILLSLSTCVSCRANELAKDKFVTIPIFYLTDRAKSKAGFGGQRKLENGTSIYSLNTGSIDCSLRNWQNKTLTDFKSNLGWRESQKGENAKAIPLDGSGSKEAYKKLGEAITEAALKTDKKEVFVIIHGFNTDFAAATKSAAELAYNVECPVVAFDWVSKGKLGQYAVDACNNEWSQEHFDRFLDELKTLKEKSGIKFTLLAHSMGNRLSIRSAPILKGQHIFKEFYLVDPDFDAETFVHYLLRYARNTEETNTNSASKGKLEPAKVSILFSHRDRALPFAEAIFGGYTRLGQAADKMLATIFEPAVESESSEPVGEKMTPENTSLTPELRPDWLLKFEWIDFTAIDKGAVGHTIPYKLISNLWSKSKPGEGLELVDSENSSPNQLSRFFLDAFHEKQHISSRLGNCKRVVVVKPEKEDKERSTQKNSSKKTAPLEIQTQSK